MPLNNKYITVVNIPMHFSWILEMIKCEVWGETWCWWYISMLQKRKKERNVSPQWQQSVVQVYHCHSSQTNWGKIKCSSLSSSLTHASTYAQHTSSCLAVMGTSDTLGLHVVEMKKVWDHSIDVCFGNILTHHLYKHKQRKTEFSSNLASVSSWHQRSIHHFKNSRLTSSKY